MSASSLIERIRARRFERSSVSPALLSIPISSLSFLMLESLATNDRMNVGCSTIFAALFRVAGAYEAPLASDLSADSAWDVAA